MKEKILEVVRLALETDDIDENTTQETCAAWDSLHHLGLAMNLEDAFGVTFEPEDIAEMKSVKDIERILAKKASM